jgi:hypothetical protein
VTCWRQLGKRRNIPPDEMKTHGCEDAPMLRSFPLSSPGFDLALTGRPSIPEASRFHSDVFGMLDARFPGHDTERYGTAFSRHEMPELWKETHPQMMRAQGRPGAG